MAILRAISGGNYWESPSKWEVYNAQTNTWSAYNAPPQDGDYCYLNGYTLKISGSNEINIGNGTIDNVGNAEIGVSAGGAIDISAFGTRNVTANFVIGDQQMYRFASATGYIWSFIGDITIVGTASFGGGAINGNNTINIIGNVTFKNASLLNLNTVISSLTITGNVTSEGGQLYNVATPVTINGNVTDLMLNSTTTINGSYTLAQYNSDSDITATVNGALNLFNGHYLSCTTLNFYGDSIKYSGWATDSIGNLKVKDLNIGNLTNFTWHDISVVRIAPFIIVTDADMNNRQQYPPENEVKEGTEYIWGEKVGTYTPDYPPESVVLQGYVYDNGDKTGSMSAQAQVGCVTKEDVREGVALIGMGEVGTLVVPSVDDVREGVVFDNGSVGTLIVQGGGERLRIADFGYYTNAQSDTYIVDLTEQDKPKFAVAEERVLIEMFPDLDLENIPEKYFDDLFVKYLKYRLIVEYYRTAGINSTFTPSEPTTEIVDYQNVRNEVWLNSANIYLKAWSKKYPESIVKPQRILL